MQSIPCYRVRHASGPVIIDGRLEERDWQEAERFELRKVLPLPGDASPLRARTRVAALWDEANLYLSFEVDDREIWATLTEHDARLFEEECIEFFIDPAGDGHWYIETQINSLNTVRDLLVDRSVKKPSRTDYDKMALWHFQNLRTAVDVRPGWGWALEVAIPWQEFTFSRRIFPPQPDQEIRINCYRYERSRSGAEPLELSAWSEVECSFHEPCRFGRFVFV